MASLNKVFLIGNLVYDPELRRIPAGTPVVTLRVAVNETFTKKSGESGERSVFLDVDVWDRAAENCHKYLRKGSPVFVEGRLQMDTWEDRETNQKRSRLKVRADRVQFLSGPGGSGGGSSGGGYRAGAEDFRDAPPSSESPGGSPAGFQDMPPSSGDDEDIPF